MSLALVQTFAQTTPSATYDVGLRWNRNPEDFVVRYEVNYYSQKDANNVPTDLKSFPVPNPPATDPALLVPGTKQQVKTNVPELQYGVTYRFYVVAVADSGLMSEPSDEVTYVRYQTPSKPAGLTIDIP